MNARSLVEMLQGMDPLGVELSGPVLGDDDEPANAPSGPSSPEKRRKVLDRMIEEARALPADAPPAPQTAGTSNQQVARQTVVLESAQYPFMKAHNIVPVIANVVAMFNVGNNIKLDLKDIAMRCKNAEYIPKRFSAVVFRLREPKCTALLFETGKIIVTGALAVADSKMGGRKLTKILKKLGYKVQFLNYAVQNMVAVCDLGAPIALESFASQNEKLSSYEPELFPGVIFRIEKPKVVCLLFVSGKIVFTGARSKEDIFQACELMYPLARKYMKRPASEVRAERRKLDGL